MCLAPVHNDVATGGAGIGAELHVARPPLLVRRLAGKSVEGNSLLRFDSREAASRGMTYPCL
jgi:hypothetical protein